MGDNEKYILSGEPAITDICALVESLPEFIFNRLEANSDAVAIIDGVTGKEITFNEIKDSSLKFVEYFKHIGLKRGDVIAISSENRLEFPICMYSAFALGISVTTINLTYTEREMQHAIGLTEPKVIFASPYVLDKILLVSKKNPFIKQIILFDDNIISNDVIMFNQILKDERFKPKEEFIPEPTNMDEQVSLIMMSSGTTGLPKGVQITEKNILTTIGNSLDAKAKLYDENDGEIIMLSIIPWFHVYGLMTVIHTNAGAVKLVLLPKFESKLFLNAIEKFKVTHCFMVPPLMLFMAKHPLVEKYDLSSLRELLCGAAPLSREVEDAVKARLPHLTAIRQGYGMSETTLTVLGRSEKYNYKPGSVGNIVMGVSCKVIDIETGKLLGPNQPGELCFKGPLIMKGYKGDKTSTAATVDDDGWIHTGDIGYYDEDKEFFIVDRIKELIKYKAFQVPPAELEAILLTNPKVQDAAVIGLPDDECGELPLAFVVKQPGVDVTEKEIQDFVAERVSSAKRLHGGVRFIDEIPKNISGKILRRELRALIAKPKSKL